VFGLNKYQEHVENLPENRAYMAKIFSFYEAADQAMCALVQIS